MSKQKQQAPDLKRGHRYLLEDKEGRVHAVTVLDVADNHFHFRYDAPNFFSSVIGRWERKERFLSSFWHGAELQVIKELKPLPPQPLTVEQCLTAVVKYAPASDCPKCDGVGCMGGCEPLNWVRALGEELEALSKPPIEA